MNEMQKYLDDGVYAEFDGDGIILRLRHSEHMLDTAEIYIDYEVLQSLNDFYIKCLREAATK